MGQTIFEKIIRAHMVEGECTPGKEVAIKIDQTLTQDSLGAMAYLQFEAMHKPKVETELSVSYTDHLMLQLGQGNGDVHRYLETVADKFGIVYSKAGNGICHQVHLERFSKPGKTLIGSDSQHRDLRERGHGGLRRGAAWTWPWPWAAFPSTLHTPGLPR